MKAWQIDRLGGELRLNDIPMPKLRSGSVLVRIETSCLMSYLKTYVKGELPTYSAPSGMFTPGGNGVGVIYAVGRDVWHLKSGQRVVLSSHFIASENVAEPAQILMGVTSFGGVSKAIQDSWRNGTLAEYALFPVEAVTPVVGLQHVDAVQLSVLSRCIVPYGGLLRGRLEAGETLVVTGATGAYGSAAVLVALAMGAGRVIAAGRNTDALKVLAGACGRRVIPVTLTGNVQVDMDALREASDGGVQLAFDMVGQATDPNATLAALGSLSRGGRLVLMGSMTSPLPVNYLQLMANNLEIIGNFMYPVDANRRLLNLMRAGQLDISPIIPKVFSLAALPEAMEEAASARSLECVVMQSSVV